MDTLDAIVASIDQQGRIVFECAKIGRFSIPRNSKLLARLGELQPGAHVKMTFGEYGEIWRVRLP